MIEVQKQQFQVKKKVNWVIKLCKNPNLGRTPDCGISKVTIFKGNPNLSRGLNYGFYGVIVLVLDKSQQEGSFLLGHKIRAFMHEVQ